MVLTLAKYQKVFDGLAKNNGIDLFAEIKCLVTDSMNWNNPLQAV